jgi:two-component system chemotaxis response regulator CheY
VRALIVDDSRAMRMILASMLREMQFETFEAENGVQGLARLQELPSVDLALVDWNMPEMNGLELIRAIRQRPEYRKLCIVVVTSEAEQNHILRAMTAGANEYVTKPFEKQAMLDKLQFLGFGAGPG